MVRLGAVTHSVNMEQRYVPLSFTAGGGNITATAPLNANIAPPGYYMLFVIGTDGVPSVANMVRVENDTSPPAAPSLTDTDPDSPANDNNPEVKGSAEAGSTVRIYSTADCSGSPLASGSAAAFSGAGITTPVPGDQTTNLRATATDAAGNTSGCSTALAYTEDSTAPATPSLTDTDPDSPGQRQQPRGQGLGRGRLDGADLLDRRLHRLAARERHRRRLQRRRDHDPGPGKPDHQPSGHGHRCRRQRLGLLERPRLHRGLDRPRDAEHHRHRPRLAGQRQQPRGQGLGRGRLDGAHLLDRRLPGSPLASGTAATFSGAGITTPVPGDQTTNLRATATDAAGNTSACSAALAYTEDSTAPAAPTLTDTDPDSPANDNNPEVKGSAEAGSTVRIYSTSDCSGTPLASGTAADLQRRRDHDPGPRRPDHQPPRHRHRRRRQHLGLLGALAYTEDSTQPPPRRASPTPTPTRRPTTTTPRSRARPRPARRSRSTRPPTARARRSQAASPPPSRRRDHHPGSRRPDHQPSRHRHRRRRQHLGLLERPRLHRGLLRPRDPEHHRHRPRLARQRQQPRGQGLGRGGLDGQDLLDRRLHGLAARERHRRRLHRRRDHHAGPGEPDHQPSRHRHRRRRQHLGLLGPARLHRGLDRPRSPEPHRHRPRLPGQRQQPRGQGLRRGRLDGPHLLDRRLHRHAAGERHRRRPSRRRDHDPGPRRPDHQPPRHRHRRGRQHLGLLERPRLHRGLHRPRHAELTDTDPDSPANDNNPEVKGSAEAGSTVRIYSTADCSGTPLASGTAADLQRRRDHHPGRRRPDHQPSRHRHRRRRQHLRLLAALAYTEDSTAPQTQVDSGPQGPTNDPTPSFGFSADRRRPELRMPLRLRLVRRPARDPATPTPASPPLSDGAHTFEVRATDSAQNTDQTPASRSLHGRHRRPRGAEPHRHRPRLPGQRQQPRGQGLGRGRLDGPDLLDRRLHRLAARERHRRRLHRRRDHAPVPDEPDHQPSRHRHRRRRQHLGLLVGARLHRGLDRSRDAEPHRHRPRLARQRQQPRGQGLGRGRLDGQDLLDRRLHGLAARKRLRRRLQRRRDHDPGPRRSDHQPSRHRHRRRPATPRLLDAPSPTPRTRPPPRPQIDSGPEGPTYDNDPELQASRPPAATQSFECRFDARRCVRTLARAPATHSPSSPTSPDGSPHASRSAPPTRPRTPTDPGLAAPLRSTPRPPDPGRLRPPGPDQRPTPSFGFSATGGAQSFECRFDSGLVRALLGTRRHPHRLAAALRRSPQLRGPRHRLGPEHRPDPGHPLLHGRHPAPQTQIDSGPQGPTNDNDPELRLLGHAAALQSFECRFDSALASGPARGPATPRPPHRLADGAHTFEVRATDSAPATPTRPRPPARLYGRHRRPRHTEPHRHRPRLPGQRQQPRGQGLGREPARPSASTRPRVAPARRLRAARPPPSTAPGSPPPSPATRPPTFAPPRPTPPATPRAARRRSPTPRIRLPRRPEPDRHRPRLAGQRQQPRGQGLGRGRLHGQDLLDRRLHGHAARERLGRRLSPAPGSPPRSPAIRPPTSAPRATDSAGNTSACSSALAYTEDSTAPQTQVDSGPQGPTNDSDPELRLLGHRRRPELRMPLRLRLVRALLGTRRHPHCLAAALRRSPHLRGPRHRLGPEHRPDPGQPLLHGRHRCPPDPNRLRPPGPDQRQQPRASALGRGGPNSSFESASTAPARHRNPAACRLSPEPDHDLAAGDQTFEGPRHRLAQNNVPTPAGPRLHRRHHSPPDPGRLRPPGPDQRQRSRASASRPQAEPRATNAASTRPVRPRTSGPGDTHTEPSPISQTAPTASRSAPPTRPRTPT